MRSLALLAALAFACRLHAQSTLADLRSRLVKQPLYLRGQWREDKLRFDAFGQLIGTSAPTAFTIAGIEIRSVDLKADRLVLKGKRAGLKFKQDKPERVVIDQEPIQIEIAAPPTGDYTVPLDHLLTANVTDLLHPAPSYWLPFARQHLLPVTTPNPASGVASTGSSSATREPSQPYLVGGSATAPRAVTYVDAHFSDQARSLHYSASVVVQLVIDGNGDPSHLVILHPAGLELDEQALAAVSHYKFAPSTRAGLPVPVQVDIVVNFQIN